MKNTDTLIKFHKFSIFSSLVDQTKFLEPPRNHIMYKAVNAFE